MKGEIQSILGARLRKYRLETKCSIEEMAHKADMNVAQLGKIERGERNFTINTLDRILKALELEYAEFFDIEENRSFVKDPLAEEAVGKMKEMTVAEQEQFYRTTAIFAERKNQKQERE